MKTCLVALLVANSAWATGERVRLAPSAEPLRDAVCVSMTCVDDGDFLLSATEKNGALELTLQHGSQRRVVHTVPLRDGQLSTVDAMSASAAVVKAIEMPAPPARAKSTAKKRKPTVALARR